jgi:hypothetical protein
MTYRRCFRWLPLGMLLAAFSISSLARADGPSAEQVARQVDTLLAQEVFQADTSLAPRVDDATYLRRVWLDIVGDIPTPEHVTAFLLDPAQDKRERVVRALLANPQYGQNWARYWRDVILSRRLEDRAAIVANPLTVWLTEQFNNNEPWDKIASEFITAKGDVRENGATAIEMAQDGRTEETTAEVSRIFLGIQIQCAQCHDHKTDRWKREQFHELAAFFPRIAVRPVPSPTKRSFEVVASDALRGPRRPNPNQRQPEPEHYMPDLYNPEALGKRMQPTFFLTGAKLPFGATDAERRGTLAQWMTDNPWFATAFVNRLWSELVGEGFYEPIDDIGPERTPSAPKTVELLSKSFAENGYDIKWLFRAVSATEAYQRESRPRREIDGTPFVANVAQPLRSDQLYNALLTAVDMAESDEPLGRRNRRPQPQPVYGRNATQRAAFEAAFGYDPSDPRASVSASIPQALAMMNGTRMNLAIRAVDRDTVLGRLLKDIKENEALVEELYLRTLSREPTEKERVAALEYIETVNSRPTAFEDLFWALLNSSEFSHRR